jgi:hypothetical protein
MLEDRDLKMDAAYTADQLLGDQTLVPYFFVDTANDATDQALTTIKDRITALLTARY